jgi:hypothetical protein
VTGNRPLRDRGMVLFSQNQKSGSLTAGDLNRYRASVNEHALKKGTHSGKSGFACPHHMS